MAAKLQQNLWILVVPVLLLATGLAVQRLADYPLDRDEIISFETAGGKSDSPVSLFKIWENVTNRDPDQAYGFPIILSIWGRVFGWSEFVVRLLPYFAGLIAIAWISRAGSDMFSPQAGLTAAILLVTSVYYTNFLHIARAYSMVALFSVLTLWSYWHLALQPNRSSKERLAKIGLLAGSIGIFYTHYYAVLLLVTIGFWHLIFMPKNRRWWQISALFFIAGIAFLLELPGFLGGIDKTQTIHWYTTSMYRTGEILPWFIYIFSNGLVEIPRIQLSLEPNLIILVILISVSALGGWKFRQYVDNPGLRFLSFVTLVTLLSMLFVNEIILVMRSDRVRYMMALWPTSALLLGWGLWRLRGRWRLPIRILISGYFLFGLWSIVFSDINYEVNEFLVRNPLIEYTRRMELRANQHDLLLIGDQLFDTTHNNIFRFPRIFKESLLMREITVSRFEFMKILQDELRVWVLAGEAGGAEHRTMTGKLPPELLFCERAIDQSDLVLELYTWTTIHCPSDAPAQIQFGEDIELAASGVEQVTGETLRVDLLMHSDQITAMTAYSVAIHVYEVESGEKVAQGDQGLWLGRYNPVRSEIDISTLTPGEYELKIGLYNWQTFEHLQGVDLTSGATAELLTLSRFRVE